MTTFPTGFLWGTATAAHQVEGNNTNSDFWVLEHVPGPLFAEPSGDACDHYRLFRHDIGLLRELGFNAYRFSIEWARVEPEAGFISKAALRHYAEVLEACHTAGLTPMVTLHHFTSPRWLMQLGGWESPETPRRLAAYARAVMEELGSLIPYVCTINEANILALIKHMRLAQAAGAAEAQAPVGVGGEGGTPTMSAWLAACAQALSTTPERLKPFLLADPDVLQPIVMAAHQRARDAVRAVRAETQVGLTLTSNDVQAVLGGEAQAEALRAEVFGSFLPACADDDFIGIQNYTRQRVGPHGPLGHPEGAEVTQMGYEFYPEGLEGVLRMAAAAGKPLLVTENGVATANDSRRVEFIGRALAGVRRCLDDGLDVRGYFYWSALDNFEWMFGYRPTFGLIAVDRATQTRRVKDSARYLGQVARNNGLPA